MLILDVLSTGACATTVHDGFCLQESVLILDVFCLQEPVLLLDGFCLPRTFAAGRVLSTGGCADTGWVCRNLC